MVKRIFAFWMAQESNTNDETMISFAQSSVASGSTRITSNEYPGAIIRSEIDPM